ncbi:hypothetical protein IKF33_02110 [Candidatus Saccharibacteria bacterium]|nr:hypothetical protein [Candidatus Saccharibacteria bacterium]
MKRLLFLAGLILALYGLAVFVYFPMFRENINATYDYYDKICDIVYSGNASTAEYNTCATSTEIQNHKKAPNYSEAFAQK